MALDSKHLLVLTPAEDNGDEGGGELGQELRKELAAATGARPPN